MRTPVFMHTPHGSATSSCRSSSQSGASVEKRFILVVKGAKDDLKAKI